MTTPRPTPEHERQIDEALIALWEREGATDAMAIALRRQAAAIKEAREALKNMIGCFGLTGGWDREREQLGRVAADNLKSARAALKKLGGCLT